MARKAMFDTNVFIDWLRARRFEDALFERPLERHLSSVVWMELLGSAFTTQAQRTLARLTKPYVTSGRVVSPAPRSFERAGRLIAVMRAAGDEVARASFINDLLIALTARQMGATVITRDRDFARIQAFERFDLEIVE
jgi:predicted nucleic acid-binding protein